MISVSLPPVFFGARVTFGEMFEAFSVAYQASYSLQAVQPRVLDSMQRSWGIIDLYMFPRVEAVNPGVCVARVGTTDNFRLVIGIEGMASASQILSSEGLDPVGIGGTSGYVVKLFNDSQIACAALVAANPLIASWLANSRIPVTFAGFSQGAAIAEIWAVKQKLAVRNKQVKFVKFASPRVGTTRWRDYRNPYIQWSNVYTETDPICNIPFENETLFLPGIPQFNHFARMAYYNREATCLRLRLNGSMFSTFNDVAWATMMYRVTQYSRAMTPTNPWWMHQLDMYRLAMCALGSVTTDDYRYRFLYQEFNDENQWGLVYRPGTESVLPGMKALLLPQPDPVTPQFAQEIQLGRQGPGAGDRGVADPINNDDIAAGQGNWGDAAPVLQTQFRPQRRVRTYQARR